MFICLPKKEIFTRHTEKNIPMIYRPPYPSYIDPTTHGIWPPINGILTCYPWYIDPLYPWYFDPPTHGILTPLSMVIWPPSQWFIEPPIHGILTPLPISWLEMRGSKFHTGGQNTMDENWPRSQFTMGVKIPYDTDPFFIHHLSPDL